MTAPYRALFDHVLTRTDPEQAHHAAFAAIRAAGPVTSTLTRQKRALERRRPGRSVHVPGAHPAEARTSRTPTRQKCARTP